MKNYLWKKSSTSPCGMRKSWFVHYTSFLIIFFTQNCYSPLFKKLCLWDFDFDLELVFFSENSSHFLRPPLMTKLWILAELMLKSVTILELYLLCCDGWMYSREIKLFFICYWLGVFTSPTLSSGDFVL